MSIKMSAVILAALVFALDANAIIGHRVQGRPTDAKLISEGGAAEQKAKNAAEKLEKKEPRRRPPCGNLHSPAPFLILSILLILSNLSRE